MRQNELRSYQRSVARLDSVVISDRNEDSVTIPDAKGYARVDGSVDDLIFDMLIKNAQDVFEKHTGKLLQVRSVTAVYDSEGYSVLILPYMPVKSIVSVQNKGDDVEYSLKGDRLHVDADGEIKVVYECGLGHIPEVQLSLLKWIVSNYEDRQDVSAVGATKMPNDSRSLFNKFKNYSL